MADLSTQNSSGLSQRLATALLRASGGTTASLEMSPLQGDSTDAGQLGLNAPGFLSLPLSPVVFRKARVSMGDGKLPNYELLISADAVAVQVSQLAAEFGADAVHDGQRCCRRGEAVFDWSSYRCRKARGRFICIGCCYRKPAASGPFESSRRDVEDTRHPLQNRRNGTNE